MGYWKIIISVTLFLLLMLPLAAVNSAEPDDIGIILDGKRLSLDRAPVIIDGRTLVPLRGVLEELGATVDWNKETDQAIVKDETIEILLAPDTSSALLNGRLTALDVASTIIDERMLIPVRFVAEGLGYDVDWNGSDRDVIITTKTLDVNTDTSTLPIVGNREALVDLLNFSDKLHHYVGFRFGMFESAMPELRSGDDVMLTMDTEEALTLESAKAEGDFSGTNNQVAGVDEGDIVKTNGSEIATVSGNTVTLIDADPQNPSILSEITMKEDRGYINNLYLTEDRLLVIGTSYVLYGIPETFKENGRKIAPSYSTNNTFLMVYDITSTSGLALVMDMDYEGYYVSSRLVEDDLYMVTEKGLNLWNMDNVTDYELQPKYADNLSGEITLLPYDQLRYFPDYLAQSMMMTIGVDLKTQESTVEAYLGRAETVYATTDNLYLSFTNYTYSEQQVNSLIYVPNYTKSTSIYSFELENGTITYKNEGSVPGTVLNQFSMDLYDGHLRVATTTGEMWDENNLSKNNLYILDENLEIIGQVTDLAPGERIYSTRFHEDRIYMVTFRQVDPFFVIDASDPRDPEVLGELKIPGFSTYMHILDSNHVLGFGSDTYEENGGVRTGGMKLSLFDVTDPANPVESKNEVIGVAGTYSELQYNHKALMISLGKEVMGFPITVAGSTPYVTDFNGAYVYDVTTDSFNYRGQITHLEEGAKDYYGDGIQRLLYIGDYLYSLSSNKLMVSDLMTLEKVSELKLSGSQNVYPLPIIVEPMEDAAE